MCRACKTVIPRTPLQPTRKGEAVDELAFALAVTNLRLIVQRIVDDHAPRVGLLIPVLSVATASLVGVLTAPRVAGLWATALGAGGGLMVMLVLWLARVISFFLRHPTLAEWQSEIFRLERADSASEDQNERVLELTMLAAHQYVADEDWELTQRAFERAMRSD